MPLLQVCCGTYVRNWLLAFKAKLDVSGKGHNILYEIFERKWKRS